MTLFLGSILTTTTAQTEIVGNWKDKSLPEKIITSTQSANYFVGKDT